MKRKLLKAPPTPSIKENNKNIFSFYIFFYFLSACAGHFFGSYLRPRYYVISYSNPSLHAWRREAELKNLSFATGYADIAVFKSFVIDKICISD